MAVIYSNTTASAADWVYSESDASNVWSDNGQIGGHRQLQYVSSAGSEAGSYAQIAYTVTGLTSGFQYKFTASITNTHVVNTLGNGVIMKADGATLVTNNTFGSQQDIVGTFVASGTTSALVFYYANGDFGAGVTNTYDIWAVTVDNGYQLVNAQGSFTLTGQTLTFTLGHAYTLVMAAGTFVLTGQALTFVNSLWTRLVKNVSVFTNSNKSTP